MSSVLTLITPYDRILRDFQEELIALLATEQSIKDFSSWQMGYQQERQWKTPPGPWPDARLPYEWRYGERAWRAVELYDRWLRGEVLRAGEEGEYEEAIECGEVEVKGLLEAELVNHILAAALRYDLCLGDDGLVPRGRSGVQRGRRAGQGPGCRRAPSGLEPQQPACARHALHPPSDSTGPDLLVQQLRRRQRSGLWASSPR